MSRSSVVLITIVKKEQFQTSGNVKSGYLILEVGIPIETESQFD